MKRHCPSDGAADTDHACDPQLLLTGNMLFEILDPFLLWKQIYCAVRRALNDDAGLEVRLASPGSIGGRGRY